MDEKFGPLLSFNDIELLVLDHYKHWIPVWIAARERHIGVPSYTIARPRSYLVKQTFTALPGEERTPIVIAVSDGFQSAPERRGDGHYEAYLRFGIAVVCMGAPEGKARTLAGHYQAALLGIAVKHQKIADGITMNEFRDLKIDDIDEETTGRSMCAARIELTYCVSNFVEDIDPPEYIVPDPPEPVPPQPDDPLVEKVFIETNVYSTDPEEVFP